MAKILMKIIENAQDCTSSVWYV